MRFCRFMRAEEFAREIGKFAVSRGEHVGSGFLEGLEASGLLRPRLRLRYPDPVARRFWQEAHADEGYRVSLPVEPDGERWDAAVALDEALHRWGLYCINGLSSHPLDDPDPRFHQFIEVPSPANFQSHRDRWVDVSNDVPGELFDDGNVEDYYSSVQILYAAEIADAGVHIRFNVTDPDALEAAEAALRDGRVPRAATCSMSFRPIHAARAFEAHARALDAIVWFAEERSRVLSNIVMRRSEKRSRLDPQEAADYEQLTIALAKTAMRRFGIDGGNLIAAMRFLAEYWSNWEREAQSRRARAYKLFLARAALLLQAYEGVDFASARERVGRVGGWFKPILEVIWPDWAEKEKNRTFRTLKSAMAQRPVPASTVTDGEIESFVTFLALNGHEAFFWRLRSFEEHALRGNEFAADGMRSDIEGMAIAVEHVAAALGATQLQLYEKLKQLWRDDADVMRLLKRGDVSNLARSSRPPETWPDTKAKIRTLAGEPGGAVAADLVMAHRLRGGVHAALPETDHSELEALFIGLMRAALLTFIRVQNAPQPPTGTARVSRIAEEEPGSATSER